MPCPKVSVTFNIRADDIYAAVSVWILSISTLSIRPSLPRSALPYFFTASAYKAFCPRICPAIGWIFTPSAVRKALSVTTPPSALFPDTSISALSSMAMPLLASSSLSTEDSKTLPPFAPAFLPCADNCAPFNTIRSPANSLMLPPASFASALIRPARSMAPASDTKLTS